MITTIVGLNRCYFSTNKALDKINETAANDFIDLY